MQLTRRAAAICGVAELTGAPSPEPASRGSGVFGSSGAGSSKKIVLGWHSIHSNSDDTAALVARFGRRGAMRCDGRIPALDDSRVRARARGRREVGVELEGQRCSERKGIIITINPPRRSGLSGLSSLSGLSDRYSYLFIVYRSPDKRMSP